MWKHLPAVLAVCALVLTAGCARHETNHYVSVQVPAAPKPTDKQEVDRLIDGLVALESFDTGLSSAYGGSDFPPVPGQGQFHVGLLGHSMPHRRHAGLTRLVELGPHALESLLRHLDDKRPTKLVITHDQMFGGMWHEHEVPIRPGNSREEQAVKQAGFPEEDPGASLDNGISKHAVTVGDACFVIIGMITNRSYNAVRYQPTACQVINSPTSSPAIAKAVRGMWNGGADAETLFQHLKGDFDATRADHANSAATRLLYYFPNRSGKQVHERLEKLIRQHGKEDDYVLSQFLNAVAWAPDPNIRATVRGLLRKTKSPGLVRSGVPAFADADDPENYGDLLRLADRMKRRRDQEFVGASRAALRTNLTSFPARKSETVRRFLRNAGHSAHTSCCVVCYQVADPPVAELTPLLAMKEEGYGHYLIPGTGVLDQPDEGDYLTYRLCDNAYEVISRALGDKNTTCTGDRREMDRRIAALRKRLEGEPAAWPFSEQEIAARQGEQDKLRLAKEARQQRIEKTSDQAEVRWFLVATDPGSTPEEIEKAVAALLTPTEWEPHESAGSVMANRRDELPTRRDALDKTQQDAVTKILNKRVLNLLEADSRNNPDPATLNMACLLARWDCTGGRESLAKLVALAHRLPAHHGKDDGFRMRFPDLSGLLSLLDELLDREFPMTGPAFRAMFRNANREVLTDMSNEREFLRILGAHWRNPDVAKVLETMFLDPKSEWHLSKTTYAEANNLGEAGLVMAPPFRRALRRALDDQRVKGSLTIKMDKPDYCWIAWKESQSGKGIGKDDPVGVKPGGKGMPIRHCDALLEGICNCVFFDNPGPEFEIYWPLANRERARMAWIDYLEKE